MKSSSRYEYFICPDMHNASRKANVLEDSRDFCAIISRHGAGCRTKSILGHPDCVLRNAQRCQISITLVLWLLD